MRFQLPNGVATTVLCDRFAANNGNVSTPFGLRRRQQECLGNKKYSEPLSTMWGSDSWNGKICLFLRSQTPSPAEFSRSSATIGHVIRITLNLAPDLASFKGTHNPDLIMITNTTTWSDDRGNRYLLMIRRSLSRRPIYRCTAATQHHICLLVLLFIIAAA
jgi:hypothetical protein